MNPVNIEAKSNTNPMKKEDIATMSEATTTQPNTADELVSALLASIKAAEAKQEHAVDKPIVEFPKRAGIEVRAGETRIGLPEDMTPEKATRVMGEYVEAQKQTIRSVRQIKGRIEDVWIAVHMICEKQWGTTGRGIPFRGQPPMFDDVQIGVDANGRSITKRVIVSNFSLEPLSAEIDYGAWMHEEYGVCGMVSVVSTKSNEAKVTAFLDAVETFVENHSIYKGKVVEFRRKKNPDQMGEYELTHRAVKADQNIVYTRYTEKRLKYNLFGTIEQSDAFKAANMRNTFRTLLYGPYGSGKTECTIMAAAKASEYGWTTVFFSPGQDDGIRDLEAAHNLAALYAPSLLVVEDVDRYYAHDSVNAKSHITNILDGMKSKTSGVSILMTTNHLDNIPQAATRPGRMDALIEIGFLDEEATERMFRQLLGDELADDVDFSQVYEMVKETGPSFIRSTFDRARKNSIITNDGEAGHALTTDDLVFSAAEMKEQSDTHSSTKELTLADRVLNNLKEKEELLKLLQA